MAWMHKQNHGCCKKNTNDSDLALKPLEPAAVHEQKNSKSYDVKHTETDSHARPIAKLCVVPYRCTLLSLLTPLLSI